MSPYTYTRSEPTLWTVGHHDQNGKWQPESDHGSPDEAAERVRWLNGGATSPESPPVAERAEPFDEHCIVELLGHRRLAGRVREVTLAGAGMLRLDIPATEGHGAQTQYIAPSSLYRLHPTTEAIATAAAVRFRPEPVFRWELEPRRTVEDHGMTNADFADDDFADEEGPF